MVFIFFSNLLQKFIQSHVHWTNTKGIKFQLRASVHIMANFYILLFPPFLCSFPSSHDTNVFNCLLLTAHIMFNKKNKLFYPLTLNEFPNSKNLVKCNKTWQEFLKCDCLCVFKWIFNDSIVLFLK
jgi:hypothetical protein